MTNSSSTQDALRSINDRISSACELSNRNPNDVHLIAVSKNFSADHIKSAYDLGIRDFGESKFQELETKVHQLPSDIKWHFIGKLQSNKAKNVASIVDTIQTLENERQLQEIAKQDRTIDGFIQVNIASEQQKSGIFTKDLDRVLSHVLKCKQVRFRGLMTIGPVVSDPEESRIFFRELAILNRKFGGTQLSMGMSGDFEVAIQEGATHIRVGSALFGNR
ncbi:MAG: YggS family pyridoxal phosphate-dependent enzyme [Fimbriimonadaceae bacterium]